MTISSSSSKPSSSTTLSLQSLYDSGLLIQPLSNLYVLGTVHLGSQSSNEVEFLLDKIKPTHVVLEIPPSRLSKIQKQQQQRTEKESLPPESSKQPRQTQRRNLWQTFGLLPDLALEGYMNGGLSGMLFTTTIVGSSLIKMAMNSAEDELPRRNEFDAAIYAVLNQNDEVNIIPADIEFDNLIFKISKSMTRGAWIRLAILTMQQTFGIIAKDPIQRLRQEESILEWETRRRNPQTAKASSRFSQTNIPELHQILVIDRDLEFANICLQILNDGDGGAQKKKKNGIDDNASSRVVVCIVGFVHLDGIIKNIRSQSSYSSSII